MKDDLRIAFVTDLHLSAARPYYQDNWELVLEWCGEEQPALVVVGGDVVLSDPDDEEDHAFARRQLDRIPTPWLVIPGNHDVGENIVSGGEGQKKVDEARRRRWLDIFGPDFWRRDIGEWTLIGVNAQIINGNGLAADEDQKAFLAEAAEQTPDDRPIALFVHKPLFMNNPSETEVHGHCLELDARRQLLAPFAGKRLAFTGQRPQTSIPVVRDGRPPSHLGPGDEQHQLPSRRKDMGPARGWFHRLLARSGRASRPRAPAARGPRFPRPPRILYPQPRVRARDEGTSD